jgi:hypothetical protein
MVASFCRDTRWPGLGFAMKPGPGRFNFGDIMDQEDEEKLEALIDQYSLTDVLASLVDICYGKAEHLASDWQDETAAKSWEQDAKIIDRIVSKVRD